ncbi:hypothetical protein ACRALDRAFT_2101348 [Sodiomyces alcalophilus JCM 7366]|uniref:uncharacterized protein n=1 Tax=Sodiomyces alcalophilus JCM 7366 TaxID=591952 RepID=UPI0039B4AB9F
MPEAPKGSRFRAWFGGEKKPSSQTGETRTGPPKWSFGVLNDPETIEVPGSVLLLASDRNEPLGLQNAPARVSRSSIPAGYIPDPIATPRSRRSSSHGRPPVDDRKKTKDGKIILDPQPEDSENDPLNWSTLRRDAALLSLGFYCLIGGGITTILAAGFYDVADDYGVSVEDVSLTTGLYMMGMGLGSVIASPTAILYGKRPVYLVSAILFMLASTWCALSPSFGSLVAARVFQGMAISPVECLPSATIAEIYFLHERAFRIGIYTLLLLGGKNLIPLISAGIIEGLGWRWVFWIVAMIVAFGFGLLFFFVPETFWDRSPEPRSRRPSRPRIFRGLSSGPRPDQFPPATPVGRHSTTTPASPTAAAPPTPSRKVQVEFAPDPAHDDKQFLSTEDRSSAIESTPASPRTAPADPSPSGAVQRPQSATISLTHAPREGRSSLDYFARASNVESEKLQIPESDLSSPPKYRAYTQTLRHKPAKSFVEQLKPWNGRLCHDKWYKVMLRPFILFAYPPILWSTVTYSCSVGWLIVVGNTMSMIFRTPNAYNFNAIQTGLIYLSPFIGGILGTAVAGKASDIIVKAMARRNGGLYEPEFRLVMAGPVLITTVIGLMGFGWSAEVGNHWMVPTFFFGVISFGCTLGSTTSITFAVDSYRQYAGEALVTLNFSKNIFHGLVFSLFVTHWMADDGPRTMYIWLGVIQLILCLFSIPMYIYGKRARMWTVRKNLMEKF